MGELWVLNMKEHALLVEYEGLLVALKIASLARKKAHYSSISNGPPCG